MFHYHSFHKGPIFGTVVKDDPPLKPGLHNTSDLVEKLLKRIDVVSPPSSKDTDVSKAKADVSEAMDSLGAYAAIQTSDNDHRFELETFKDKEYNEFLAKLFKAFNAEQICSRDKNPRKRRSWDHIGALLGAMIELYLKYYGCDCTLCQEINTGYGSGKGYAWQMIAHKLETSDILQVKIKELFPNSGRIDLFRAQLYIEELSHCGLFCPVADCDTLANWGLALPEFSVSDRCSLAASGHDIPRLDLWVILEAGKRCTARKLEEEQKKKQKTTNYLKKLTISSIGASN
ncbi:predicted protein [Sclerotinia sclerotiorum 1980 UF-70]|uniref:Uncharacterized protein n=2 Tax=Sclerotinia sclerotiorum (strain ATCC 18683 / 1980 / Ss-1) TaxID=665079 RepID=A7EA41_SCLS1|nr:predicted protein [Sclerotinia sclerotiorum 1980 UF-70]APA08477.1 hypothetical protein sscle_04g032470 [Sclerotinia sclerotiorum 1980 UF-70]EDN99319.1 predicted protein [Sclerotinia sclerotiorum 1980 UF-70]